MEVGLFLTSRRPSDRAGSQRRCRARLGIFSAPADFQRTCLGNGIASRSPGRMKTQRMKQSSRAGVTSPRDEVELRLQATLAFMAEEFRRNPRLSEIARVAHFSEYHFHRLFRRRFGKTPKHCLVALQIEEAKRLMLGGQRPSEASRGAGFSHQSHLTARFKTVTGTTPRRWLLTTHKRGGGVASGDSLVSKK